PHSLVGLKNRTTRVLPNPDNSCAYDSCSCLGCADVVDVRYLRWCRGMRKGGIRLNSLGSVAVRHAVCLKSGRKNAERQARGKRPMTISMYKVSVPIFVQFLSAQSAIIDKLAAHIDAKKYDAN